MVYAQAHIRGGTDLGRAWYDAGKMLNKPNTFTDFIACADHLVAEKYCARDRLAIRGGSAGGLLIGAMLNRRPDVCKVAVLQVPFVDVINTMPDETLPLTVQEFQQWGNPKVKADYDVHEDVLPLLEPAGRELPGDPGDDFAERQPGALPRAGQVRGQTADAEDGPQPARCSSATWTPATAVRPGRYDHLKEQAFVTAFMLDQVGCGSRSKAE